MIYFVTDGEFIKIGRAENVADRIKGLQTGNARQLYLLASEPGERDAERAIHKAFEPTRIPYGEWFVPSRALLHRISITRSIRPLSGEESEAVSWALSELERLSEAGDELLQEGPARSKPGRLTLSQAADILGVSVPGVRRLVFSGKLKGTKVKRGEKERWEIERSELETAVAR